MVAQPLHIVSKRWYTRCADVKASTSSSLHSTVERAPLASVLLPLLLYWYKQAKDKQLKDTTMLQHYPIISMLSLQRDCSASMHTHPVGSIGFKCTHNTVPHSNRSAADNACRSEQRTPTDTEVTITTAACNA
jgi:hypothetical protein